jgi:hypothetical protein
MGHRDRTAWLGRQDSNHCISESDRFDAPDDVRHRERAGLGTRTVEGAARAGPGLPLMAIRQHMTIAARKGKAPTDRDKEGLDEDWADLQQLEGQGKSE